MRKLTIKATGLVIYAVFATVVYVIGCDPASHVDVAAAMVEQHCPHLS